jgi:hypothetical protein
MTTNHLPNGVEAILNTQYNTAEMNQPLQQTFTKDLQITISITAFHTSLSTDNHVWAERLFCFYFLLRKIIVNTKKANPALWSTFFYAITIYTMQSELQNANNNTLHTRTPKKQNITTGKSRSRNQKSTLHNEPEHKMYWATH